MRSIIATIFFAVLSMSAIAQCDGIAQKSLSNFTADYISDGQTYRSLLVDDQVAEFTSTFFGGTTYRISASTGKDKGLSFKVLDENRNVLFNSAEHENSNYWDFQVENTLNCIIEAQLDQSVQNSGCAVLLIGFKE